MLLWGSPVKLNHLDGYGELKGWQWMYLIQGGVRAPYVLSLLDAEARQVAYIMGIITYWWMVDFPEKANLSFHFLDEAETKRAVARIQIDRGDVDPNPFTWTEILRHFLDPKIYGFAAMFFLLVGMDSSLQWSVVTDW